LNKVIYNGDTSEAIIRKRTGNKIRAPFSVIGPMRNVNNKRWVMQPDVFDLLDQVSKRAFSAFNNLKYNRSLVNNISNYVATTEMDKTDKETLSRNMTELKTAGLIRVIPSKSIPHMTDDKLKYHFVDYRKTYIINPDMIRCSNHDEAEYLWKYCGGECVGK
jgi:hypothetical protein